MYTKQKINFESITPSALFYIRTDEPSTAEDQDKSNMSMDSDALIGM